MGCLSLNEVVNVYPVGFPGWKIAAKLGVTLVVRVRVFHDEESGSYWAQSSNLDGLVVSGATLDEVKSEAIAAGEALLSLQLDKRPHPTTALFTYRESALLSA